MDPFRDGLGLVAAALGGQAAQRLLDVRDLARERERPRDVGVPAVAERHDPESHVRSRLPCRNIPRDLDDLLLHHVDLIAHRSGGIERKRHIDPRHIRSRNQQQDSNHGKPPA